MYARKSCQGVIENWLQDKLSKKIEKRFGYSEVCEGIELRIAAGVVKIKFQLFL